MREFFNFLTNTGWGIAILCALSLVIWFALSIIFYRRIFKRFYDIILSFLALIILSPIYLTIAILVRVKLGSPVIFKQYRPGKNGKIFIMHKFRSMTNAKDENGELLPDKERLTKFGAFLRSSSLDELPEIWDIFRGKMSIVGARPQLVRDMVFMTKEENRRHEIRGGLTGLAQVSGRNGIGWAKKLELDIEYVENYSFFYDLKIFFKTFSSVFSHSGIAEDGECTSTDLCDCYLREGKITPLEYEQGNEKAKKLIEEFEKNKNSCNN